MTRAGEKLYGDWERRIDESTPPIRWGRMLYALALVAIIVVVGGSALFGFG
jgi:hypothetical protein